MPPTARRSCWSGSTTAVRPVPDDPVRGRTPPSPGDWILVGPGDYHETADETRPLRQPRRRADGRGVHPQVRHHAARHEPQLGHRRRHQCRIVALQLQAERPELRRAGQRACPSGRNGIVVWKANDVSIENLTVCNFLAGTGASGNEIWWNGGDESGKIGLTGYWGSYLTATSTFFSNETTGRRVRHLLQQLGGPGGLESALRQQHERLGHLRGRLPAAVRRDHEPPVDGEQRARLLGDELRRHRRHRELPVRRQPGRPGHQHPGHRRPARPAGRPVPERRDQPDHPHHLVLGGHSQLPPQQQQPQGPGSTAARRPARSAPG